MKVLINLALIIFTVFGLVWTQDLKQVNKETIFLTEKGQENYQKFQEDFSIRSLVVSTIKKENKNQVYELFKNSCKETCHVLGPDELKIKDNDFRTESKDKEVVILIETEEGSDEEFKSILRSLNDQKSVYDYQFSGVPYTNILLDEYSKKVKTTIFPMLFVGVFLLLFMFLRNLWHTVTIFIPGLMAASISLMSIKIIWQESNLITSIVPLLLFVIQMSMVLHVHFTAKEMGSLKAAMRDKIEPVALMVITTFIGFGSLYFSDLYAISQFGVLTALLLLLTTIFSGLWLFPLGHVFPHWWGQDVVRNTNHNALSKDKLMGYTDKLISKFWPKKFILVFSILAFVVGSVSLKSINVITDATQYFPEKTGIRLQMIEMAKEFIGTPLVEILVSDLNPDYETYKKLLPLEDEIKKLNGTLLSSNQLVLMANSLYTGSKTLPDNKYAYFTMRGRIPPELSEGYPIDDSYRMTFMGHPVNVGEYEQILDKMQNIFSDSGFKLSFNGLYYHLMEAQKQMIVTLFKSFFIGLLLISLLVFLYFRKLKLFFIFMFVNLVPVFASFPLLYLFDLSFNIATVMTYSISLGLVVDSSFHIIHALNKYDMTLEFFTKSVLRPILGAGLLLATCFMFFSLSDFLPIREFGIALSIAIFWGMLLDLKVLPQLYKKPWAK